MPRAFANIILSIKDRVPRIISRSPTLVDIARAMILSPLRGLPAYWGRCFPRAHALG